MKWTPLAILVGLLLEAIDVVLSRYATVLQLCEVHPEFRVFQYGKRWGKGNADADGRMTAGRWEWFFILKLPSWDWQLGDYGRHWSWYQLCLVWTDTRGWFTRYQPCSPEKKNYNSRI